MNIEDIKETTIINGELKYGHQYVDPNFTYVYDGRIYKIKEINDNKYAVFVKKLKDYSLADVLSIYTSLPNYMKSLFRRIIGIYFFDMIGVSPHGGLVRYLNLEGVDPKDSKTVFDILYDSLFNKIKDKLNNILEDIFKEYGDDTTGFIKSKVNEFYRKFKNKFKKRVDENTIYDFLYEFLKDYNININKFNELKEEIQAKFSILLDKYVDSLDFKFEKKYFDVIKKYRKNKRSENFWQMSFIDGESLSIMAIFPFYKRKNISEKDFYEILLYFSMGIPYEIYSRFFILLRNEFSKYILSGAPSVRQKLHKIFGMEYISKSINNARRRRDVIKDIQEEREREARHFFNMIVYSFENYKFNLSDVINEFSKIVEKLEKITKSYLVEFKDEEDLEKLDPKEFAKEKFYEILRDNFWDIFNSELGKLGSVSFKEWYYNMQSFLKFFNAYDEFEKVDDIDYVKEIFNLDNKLLSSEDIRKCASKFLLDNWGKFKCVFKYFKVDSSMTEEDIMKKYGIESKFAKRIRFERYLWEKFGNLGLLADINFDSFDNFEDFKEYVDLILKYKLK